MAPPGWARVGRQASDVSSWYALPSTRSRGTGMQHLSSVQSWRRRWGLCTPLSITRCKLSAADPPGAMVGLGEAAAFSDPEDILSLGLPSAESPQSRAEPRSRSRSLQDGFQIVPQPGSPEQALCRVKMVCGLDHRTCRSGPQRPSKTVGSQRHLPPWLVSSCSCPCTRIVPGAGGPQTSALQIVQRACLHFKRMLSIS